VSYSQAGSLHCRHVGGDLRVFPTFRRLRMLRNWGGIVDVADRSPIIGLAGAWCLCGAVGGAG
jgi:sarcosine oxidase subunit beta